nr:transposase [Streptomyces montanus]
MPELPLLQAVFAHDGRTCWWHYTPKMQLSKLVNSLKGVSSRRLRQKYDAHVRPYL